MNDILKVNPNGELEEDTLPGDSKSKIGSDVAEEEFERFADAWRIDTDVDFMTEDDEAGFQQVKRRMIRAIMSGNAIVNNDNNIEYELFAPIGDLTTVVIKRPSGHSFTSMDAVKKSKNLVAKTNKIYADAMGIPSTFLSSTRMDGIDYRFIQGVYSLFFGS